MESVGIVCLCEREREREKEPVRPQPSRAFINFRVDGWCEKARVRLRANLFTKALMT